MPVPIVHPPIRWKKFLEQSCLDEEYLRKSAAGVTYARGKHGGFDFQDKRGGQLLAVCSGVVRHVNFGGALGKSQFVIRRADGSGAFYAHTLTRPPAGTRVKPGDLVAEMGDSSTYSIGVHLHFETLKTWDKWRSTYNCGPDLRLLQEVQNMFTEDELKFLKNLVKAARTEKVAAADVAKTAKIVGKHLTDHQAGASGSSIPVHTHRASVSLQ